MSKKNDAYTIQNWLKIAGLFSEADATKEQSKLLTEAEDDEEPDAEESGDTEEEDKVETSKETDEESDEESDAADEAPDTEEDSKTDDDLEVSDLVTFDSEIDKLLVDFEKSAITNVESLSLSKTLLEQEKRFDVVVFTDSIARLIKNFTSLVDYEKIIIDRAEKFLSTNHDDEVSKIFLDLLADRHSIELTPADNIESSYAVGAASGE
jgi:cobalamin biosynthesis protein CobT